MSASERTYLLHDVVDPSEHDEQTSHPPASVDTTIETAAPSTPPPGPKRIVVVVSHPDDAEFICAGAVARWVREGHTVIYVLLTSGDQGGEDPDVLSETLAATREAEQLAASQILGVSETIFLRLPDGSLTADLETRKLLVRTLRTIKPDVVVCQDPSFLWADQGYINHPDHRAAGQVTLDAVFPATGNPMAYRDLHAEGLPAHKIREVYLAGAKDPDVVVDITGTIDIKLRALRAHASQLGDWDPEEEIRNWGKETAAHRPGFGDYAESFKYFKIG